MDKILQEFTTHIRRMTRLQLDKLKKVLDRQYNSVSLKTWEGRNEFREVFYKMSLVSRELRLLKELSSEVAN